MACHTLCNKKTHEPVFLWFAFLIEGNEVTELDSAVRSTGKAIFSPLGEARPVTEHVLPLTGNVVLLLLLLLTLLL
jgi:hypothetical protein